MESLDNKAFEVKTYHSRSVSLVNLYLKEAGRIPILSGKESKKLFRKIEKYMIDLKGVLSHFETGLDEVFALQKKVKENKTILDNLNYFCEDGKRVKILYTKEERRKFTKETTKLAILVEEKANIEAKIEEKKGKTHNYEARRRCLKSKRRGVQREIRSIVESIELHPLQVINISCKIVEEIKQNLAKQETIKGRYIMGMPALKAKWFANYIEHLKLEIKSVKQHVIKSNLRLVVNIAKKYTKSEVPFIDLIQEGNIGLIRAVNRYDYRKGYLFSTYATCWIKQAITRGVIEQGKTIRIPVNVTEVLKKYDKVYAQLVQKHGCEPSVAEISKYMSISEKQVLEVNSCARKTISLETPIADGDKKIEDVIKNSELSPASVMERVRVRESVRSILKTLEKREEEILSMRFGIGEYTEHTLTEIGKNMGICRERVRQLEKVSLKKLAHVFNGVQPFHYY